MNLTLALKIVYIFFSGHGFDAVNQSPDPSGAPVKLTLNPPDGSDIVPGQTVSVSLEAQGEPFKGHNGAKFLSNLYWKVFCQRKLLNLRIVHRKCLNLRFKVNFLCQKS